MNSDRTTPFVGGDLWVAVSAHGKGQPVKITRVNSVNVYFQAIGKRADESKQYKLAHDAFRVRYSPLKTADERQKRLAFQERNGTEAPIDGIPVIEAEEVDEQPEPEPVLGAPRTYPQAITSTIVPTVPPNPPPKHSTRNKLTGEQAREIYQLAQNTSYQEKVEIAKSYGVNFSAVYGILSGKSYAWATEDLRPVDLTLPPPEPKEEPKEMVPAELTVTSRQPAFEPTPKQREIEVDRTTNDHHARRVMLDLADAAETLLALQAGKALPKFLSLDQDIIRRLIDKAREIGS